VCPHIYKNVNASICPMCSGDTHETNWAEQNKLNAQWKIDNPNLVKYGGWWSI